MAGESLYDVIKVKNTFLYFGDDSDDSEEELGPAVSKSITLPSRFDRTELFICEDGEFSSYAGVVEAGNNDVHDSFTPVPGLTESESNDAGESLTQVPDGGETLYDNVKVKNTFLYLDEPCPTVSKCLTVPARFGETALEDGECSIDDDVRDVSTPVRDGGETRCDPVRVKSTFLHLDFDVEEPCHTPTWKCHTPARVAFTGDDTPVLWDTTSSAAGTDGALRNEILFDVADVELEHDHADTDGSDEEDADGIDNAGLGVGTVYDIMHVRNTFLDFGESEALRVRRCSTSPPAFALPVCVETNNNARVLDSADTDSTRCPSKESNTNTVWDDGARAALGDVDPCIKGDVLDTHTSVHTISALNDAPSRKSDSGDARERSTILNLRLADQLPVPPTLLSAGSAWHGTGVCRPCAHSWRLNGCSQGRDCSFCHACGEKEFKAFRGMPKSKKEKCLRQIRISV